jgi:protein-S-isoprenylcysteine O-methyltransferase Ste14
MFFPTVWKALYLAWFASEIYIAIATRTRGSKGKVSDRGTMLLLWIVIFSSISAGVWIGEVQGSNLPGGAHWLKPVSVLVLIAGLILRWAAILSLGKAFSANVAIQTTHTVKKDGLYRWMRHPSYTGILLCLLGVALHTRNWISFLVIVIPTTAAFLYRIHVEEIVLRNHFGQEYIEYSSHTKRLIPGIY